jgi:hypothetical protein
MPGNIERRKHFHSPLKVVSFTGGACSTHARNKECTQNIAGYLERNNLEEQRIYSYMRIVLLKRISIEWCVSVWILPVLMNTILKFGVP